MARWPDVARSIGAEDGRRGDESDQSPAAAAPAEPAGSSWPRATSGIDRIASTQASAAAAAISQYVTLSPAASELRAAAAAAGDTPERATGSSIDEDAPPTKAVRTPPMTP